MSMNNIAKICLVTLFMMFPASSKSQVVSDGFGPDRASSISVDLIDEATEACWTNLRESREYAEEKLRQKGFNVVRDSGYWEFRIEVTALRVKSGSCVGTARVKIERYGYVDNLFSIITVAFTGSIAANPHNFNQIAIETTQSLINSIDN